jgi:phosphoglycolate phosphatase
LGRKRGNILFDLDGTLTDNQIGIFRCIRYALKELGVPLEETADLRWCVGPPLQISLTRLVGGDPALGKRALDLYRRRYQEAGIFENRLYDGIIESLESLQSSFDLYVATSKPTVYALQILRHFKINSLFKAIHGSELDGTNTDKGDLIGFVLNREKLTALTFMVGDREQDVIGAHKNKIEVVGVAWGFGTEEELRKAGASTVLHHPGELMAAFNKELQ